ncbi:MAG: hypothetical protein WAP39_00410 [Bacillota bacterium]
MKKECETVKDLLLDKAYGIGDALEGEADIEYPAPQDGKDNEAGLGRSILKGAVLSEAEVSGHLRGCRECADYAAALDDISRLLPGIRKPDACERESARVAQVTGSGDIRPDRARLSATIQRGLEIRIARERRSVALFALTAAGILAAVWIPILAWSPKVLLGLQAVGFSGIALFYWPIHLLRERRGENL